MHILEMTIVIKGDPLELEAIQAAIIEKVKLIASPLTTEIVGQPILEEVDDGEEKP